MEALEDLNKSLTWNDKYSKGFLRRANLHITLGDYEHAKYDFQKVIDLEPSKI
jgi:tetratricopeptide (TPR) repeat protein